MNCRLKMAVGVAALVAATVLSGCSGKQVKRVGGFEIDSVVVDTVVALGPEKDAPRGELRLHIQYLKGEKAQNLNDTLLRAGILVPDYFSLRRENFTVESIVDSFARRYLDEYREVYGQQYQSDKEHAEAYNLEYCVSNRFDEHVKGILASTADIYSYGGGAHGIGLSVVLNIDTRSGSIIRLADLFTDGYEQPLGELIVKELCKQKKVAGLKELQQEHGIFSDGDIRASENFILGKKSVTFIYSVYEIAPYSAGEISVEIGRKDLKKLLKRDIWK